MYKKTAPPWMAVENLLARLSKTNAPLSGMGITPHIARSLLALDLLLVSKKAVHNRAGHLPPISGIENLFALGHM